MQQNFNTPNNKNQCGFIDKIRNTKCLTKESSQNCEYNLHDSNWIMSRFKLLGYVLEYIDWIQDS